MSGQLQAERNTDRKCPPDGAPKRTSEYPLDIAAMRAIPFLDGNYSSDVEPWCWIKTHNMDCSENVAGFWEQIGLFYAPFGVLGLLIVLFALLTIGVLCINEPAPTSSKGVQST